MPNGLSEYSQRKSETVTALAGNAAKAPAKKFSATQTTPGRQ
jgi:hypothetical protein